MVARVAPGNNWDIVFRVAVDHEGRILTAGDAYVGAGAGLYDVALSRYLADGTPDGSFGDAGTVLTNAGAPDSDDNAQGLAIQRDGGILVGGCSAPTAFRFDSDFMATPHNDVRHLRAGARP